MGTVIDGVGGDVATIVIEHTATLVGIAPDHVSDGQHWYCVLCGVLPPDTQAGEHEAQVLTEAGLIAGPTRPAATERAAVVAYLRNMAERGASRLSEYATAFADSIERGEHVR